jgi:hypothetical protein
MSKKGGCLLAVGVAVVLVGLIIAFVFMLTGGMVKAGNDFLAFLAAGKTHEAYLAADAALRSSQSEEAFSEIVKTLGLGDYASASWRSRSIENDQATLEGTVRTRSGGNVPLTMKLIKQGGVWRVLSLSGPAAGASVAGGPLQVPPDAELRKLTDATLAEFIAAIQAGRFDPFWAATSKLMQNQFTAEKFQAAFQEYIDKKIDLSCVKGVEPVYDQPPAIDGDGVLTLTGYYPAKPMHVTFSLKYVYEHPAWKLLAINVKAREQASGSEAEKPAVPDEPTVRKLTDTTMQDFVAAVRDKSFAAFYDTLSDTWKKQTSAQALRNAFQSFIDQAIDLSATKGLAPVYDEAPSVNDDGELVLNGHYPSKPLRASFTFRYLLESGSWKLSSVRVAYKEE